LKKFAGTPAAEHNTGLATSGGRKRRRKTMPTYEYKCNACGEEFVRIMSISEYEKGGVACPKCNSADTKQQMSPFIPKTSRKS
jgi:putative FmdB family regulatory protein